MVEWKKLGEVCEILDYLRKPVAKEKRNMGIYPYYGANGIQDYVEDYIFDGTYLLVGEDGSVINADKSPILHWTTGKIWVNNHAHVLGETSVAPLRYILYALQCTDVSDIVRGTPPKINQANLRNIQIPLPSLSEQSRIVSILDTFTSSISNLKQQIEERRKQYEYERDLLLDLEGKEGVEMKKLGEVCEIFDGTHQTPNYIDSGIRFVSVENINNLYTSNKYISRKDYELNYKTKPQRNDVLMTRIGDVGTCAVINSDEPIAFYVSLSLLRPNKDYIISKFMKFLLESQTGRKEIRKRTLLTAVPLKINLGDIGKLTLPMPCLTTQQRIVSILDTFEASIKNLEEQLALREKQYEYYRNQLLTFE